MNRLIASALLTGILCTGSVTTRAAETAPTPSGPQAGAPGMMPGPGAGRMGMGRKCFSMKEALGLSDKQDARLRELRQAHFKEAATVRQELFRLQDDLARASVSRKPDERKISDISGMIGRQHEQLALLESRHLKELATVLDSRQIDTLLRMREARGMRGDRRGRGWQ